MFIYKLCYPSVKVMIRVIDDAKVTENRRQIFHYHT